jgi:BASS family bile acid:Na+ symporter
MPVAAIGLSRWFHFQPEVESTLLALSLSPVPPLLPQKQTKAGGEHSYGLALMATLSLLAIVIIPVSMKILERVFQRPFEIGPQAIAKTVLTAALLPLAAGVIIKVLMPAFAARIEKPMALVVKVVLLLAVVALLSATLSAAGAAIGGGTILAFVLFVVAGLVVGHLMGGPDREDSVVLALSSACRHPAIALSILTASFPNERFGGIILLYLLVSAVVAIPYTVWQRKRSAGAVPATA